ncbi:TPA: flagellar transcriptional regulator FlhD [Salmonella enterica subsp. enterica serovar Muenchen]
MNTVSFDDQNQCIQDVNLSYLLLAQRLIREDKFAAGFRLGLKESIMDRLVNLSLPQLIKLSSTSQLICQFRIENEKILNCLTKDSRVDALQRIHTGIILSTNLLDSMAESTSVEV